MKDKTIITVSLLTSLIGLVLLYLITDELSIAEVDRLDDLLPEEDVRLIGKITRVTQTEKVAFLEIAHERIEPVTVVLFKPGVLILQEGDTVEIEGSIDEYQGKKQIIGNEVRLRYREREK